jgi:hypothetical protein
MAERLFVSNAAVRSHVATLLKKLQVPDRAAAVRLLDALLMKTASGEGISAAPVDEHGWGLRKGVELSQHRMTQSGHSRGHRSPLM